MGSYDGAEIFELVGHKNVGLYRDDGEALIKGTNGRNADTTRKMLHAIFQQIGLKITAQVSHQIVNFFNITLDLNNGKLSPYKKPDNQQQYVNSQSNQPSSIIKQIPKSINRRLSSLSSDQRTFDACKPSFEHALKQRNYVFFAILRPQPNN